MDAYKITGGKPLKGTVAISGSKNAALPCLFASLLTHEPSRLMRVPFLRDTKTTVQLLGVLGKKARWDADTLVIEEMPISWLKQREILAPYRLVRQMRASALVTGPLLARWGKARVALPGGCAIGTRPIDIHIDGLKAMGAKIAIKEGDMILTAPHRGLKAIHYRMHYPSVGATQNLMMAASLIAGTTTLDNAATEPEIDDLASLLNKMGAKIKKTGARRYRIEGARWLKGVTHAVIPARIETGSFAIFAALVAGSKITLKHCEPGHLGGLWRLLKKSGVSVTPAADSVTVSTLRHFRPKAVDMTTSPHPGFPTDLQPLWMALMTTAKGHCTIDETVFEKRFLHAAEMARMGAMISIHANKAVVQGVSRLNGAAVMAGDLRAGAGLVASALAAHGQSIISRIYHIERGYENLEKKLAKLGADIHRVKE